MKFDPSILPYVTTKFVKGEDIYRVIIWECPNREDRTSDFINWTKQGGVMWGDTLDITEESIEVYRFWSALSDKEISVNWKYVMWIDEIPAKEILKGMME